MAEMQVPDSDRPIPKRQPINIPYMISNEQLVGNKAVNNTKEDDVDDPHENSFSIEDEEYKNKDYDIEVLED